MLTQNLPQSATEYARSQRLEQQAALAAVKRQWRRMGSNFDLSWALIGPTIARILAEAQTRVIADSNAYIPAVLAETGQRDDQIVEPVTSQLVGVTGAGQSLDQALALAPIRAKQKIAEGATQWQALQSAGQWLTAASGLLLSDTGRAAESLNMYARQGVGGYVRMLTPPSCGRCVILAGKWFRFNQGFSRHPPTCDCRHIPAGESIAGDLTVDPRSYFDSLDPAAQNKLVGSVANGDAVRDGADIGQIVNAYRRTAGMELAQMGSIRVVDGEKFTNVGAVGTMLRIDRTKPLGQQRRERVAIVGRPKRLMPESIYRQARNRDEALDLLKQHGWIRDTATITRTRTILADTSKARAASTASRKTTSKTIARPATATGSGAGKPPTRPPLGSSAAPEPSDRDAFRAYWKARQDALEVDFKGETLEPHEVLFVERFIAAGNRLAWIPKDRRHRPTNDFTWLSNGNLVTELKSTKARYTTIRGRIEDAVRKAEAQAVTKNHFMIDLADQPLTDELQSQLATYNTGRDRYRIKRLWVMSEGRVTEIALTTK